MDGLSAAAGVIAVIQISAKVFDLCHTYHLKVKDARADIQRLRDEIFSLQSVLSKVADLANAPGSAKLYVFRLLDQPHGPIQQCETELNALATRLKSTQGTENVRHFGVRAMKWPLSSRDVDKAVTAVGRHKATFSLALAADQT